MILKCTYCGYEMDQHTCHGNPGAVVKEFDLSLCLNCGGVHEYRDSIWQAMSATEIANLDADTRHQLQRIEHARKAVVTEDLAVKQQLRK